MFPNFPWKLDCLPNVLSSLLQQWHSSILTCPLISHWASLHFRAHRGQFALTTTYTASFFPRTPEWEATCFPAFPFQLFQDRNTSSRSFLIICILKGYSPRIPWQMPRPLVSMSGHQLQHKGSDEVQSVKFLEERLKSKCNFFACLLECQAIEMPIKDVTAREAISQLSMVWWQVLGWRGWRPSHHWWDTRGFYTPAPLSLSTRPCPDDRASRSAHCLHLFDTMNASSLSITGGSLNPHGWRMQLLLLQL